MQLYVADYLGDTRHLTTEQHGAYLLLLMTMWRSEGVLPDDPIKLARIAGLTVSRWHKISADVLAFFTPCEGGFTQRRLSAELAIAAEKSEKRSQSGKAGARAKALKSNKLDTANASRLLKHSPEPEPELKKEKLTASPKKGSRLPPDWKPTEADLTFAASQNMTPEETDREADQFRDFWISKPGAGGCKLDWPATWRTWCRNRRGTGQAGKPNASGNGSKPLGMAGILAERRRQASIPDDVSSGGWVLSPDDGLSGVWINPGEPGDGAASRPVSHDAAPAGQVRGMDSGPSRGNGSPW
jgi:uncharacterized protein YdaU (DUF1376 family)